MFYRHALQTTYQSIIYLKMAFLLSGDINLNPGFVTRHQFKNNPTFDAFNNKGLHLIRLKINSLLPKIDKLRDIAESFNAAVTE